MRRSSGVPRLPIDERMDAATVIGLFAGAALIVSAIVMGGSAAVFVDGPGSLIVLGGTVAATLVRFPLADVIGSLGVAAKTFFVRTISPVRAIERITALAQIARKEGLLGLDGKDSGDEFLARGIGMMIDAVPSEQVTTVLARALQYSTERHDKGRRIFKGMATAALAFGVVGTLIGMVRALAATTDPGMLGPATGRALLTTLYGMVFAHLVALPIADKLDLRSQEESLTRELTIAGVAALQRGEHPRRVEEELKVFLAPKARQRTRGAAVG
jgi:chemotaxis protein MotA